MKNILSFFILFTVGTILESPLLNAQTKEEKTVAAAVEILNKKDFVDLLVNAYYVYSKRSTSDQTIHVTGNTAVVRHHLIAKHIIGGTPADMNLGVLQVWKQENGSWKLLARQGFKM